MTGSMMFVLGLGVMFQTSDSLGAGGSVYTEKWRTKGKAKEMN